MQFDRSLNTIKKAKQRGLIPLLCFVCWCFARVFLNTFRFSFFLRFVFQRHDFSIFRLYIYALRKHIIISIIAIGAAPSVVNIAGSAINIIVNRSLIHYGSDNAVAAAGIFTTYTSLLVMIVIGICQGLQPIIGYNYGAGRTDRLRHAFWLAVGWSSAICTAGCAFGLACPQLIARAFTTDASLISQTSRAFSFALLAFWAVGFQVVATTFFQSIGNAAKSIFLSLIRQVIFLIPLLLVLPRYFGLDGVWYSFPVSDLLATIVTLFMIVWQLRKISRTSPACS